MRAQDDIVGVAEHSTANRHEVGGLTRAWLLDLVSEKLLGKSPEKNTCEEGHKDG